MKPLLTLAAALAATATLTASAHADAPQDAHQLLLDVDFAARDVVQVEVGDFHFTPGQLAPVHTHAAPAIGYVSKGTIYYQVEGMPAQILKAGDAFYEPVGPRILHFDNTSATEEAVFTDFNLEQAGEPFIVFPKPLTEKIDRRTFPTAPVAQAGVTKATAYADSIAADRPLVVAPAQATVGYVASGTVTIQLGDGAAQKVVKGMSFNVPAGATARIAAKGGAAKIVTFQLRS